MPVAFLVAYSQIIVKWRASLLIFDDHENYSIINKLFWYLLDPYIFSGYLAAFVGSFLWLFILSKISLSSGFPIYIGVTFIFILVGGRLFLNEVMTNSHLWSVAFILIGVYLGVKA
jgi:hypothetical protein